MTPDCPHSELEFSPEVTDVFDDKPPWLYVAISVRCSECHVPFHWRGLNSGRPNRAEPAVTADGFLLFAPIAVGPGAIVGLLEKTGLGDKLIRS